jgi:hypothetical protein
LTEERGGGLPSLVVRKLRIQNLKTIRKFKVLSFERVKRGKKGGRLPSLVIIKKTQNCELKTIRKFKVLNSKRVERGERGVDYHR